VAADGAEHARMVERDVEGAEASHRDAADRESVRVDPEASDHSRDHFIDDVGIPVAVGPVVPVAVDAAGWEGNHRP
jgi:hypothetical protein